MTSREFLEQLCDIIGGEDAINRFTKDELLDMLKDMSTSHEEFTNWQECKDAADAHETFYPNLCDV